MSPKYVFRLLPNLVLTIAVSGRLLEAQIPDAHPVKPAASTITAATLAQQVAILATDSFWNRRTPSAALARTAEYIAQFAQSLMKEDSTLLALRRQAAVLLADSQPDTAALKALERKFQQAVRLQKQFKGSLQSYAVPRGTVQLDRAASEIGMEYPLRFDDATVVDEGGKPVRKELRLSFATAARLAVPRVTQGGYLRARGVMLLTGRPTTALLRQLAGKAVLYIPPADLDTGARRAILDNLYRAGRGAVLLAGDEAGPFGAAQTIDFVENYFQDLRTWAFDYGAPGPWVAEVRAGAVVDLLTRLGVDVRQARAAQAPAVRELPSVDLSFKYPLDTTNASRADSAVNAIIELKGTDPMMRQQCVVVTAPLDQRGPLPAGPDRVTRGGDPSTVSLAGLLELVRAFSNLPTPPKRSVVWLAASGGASGQKFWGSHAFTARPPCTPIASLTVDLGVGGPMAGDTAVLGGLEEVELATPPTWVAAAHPDLGLTVVDGGSVTRSRSDASVFNWRVYPSLVLQQGTADSGAAALASTTLELERTARLLRLVFYLAQGVVDDPGLPQWSAAGRRRAFGP